MIRVSAAVINWNNRDHILACLDSLFGQQAVEIDAVMLDNGSTDGSCGLVRERFPRLRIIDNGRNLGFAAAHNIGYRATSGEWHFVLNSDVVLEPDYLIRLLNSCAAETSVGAVSGKLLRFGSISGPTIIDSAGIEIFESRRVWDRGTGEVDQGQFDRPHQVFGCCGAAALYRREMLEKLAPDGEIFPEIYFAYYEDVDLSWRMNLAGWQCLFVPQAVGRHVRGGATRGSAITRRLVFRNRYILLARNDRHAELLHHLGPVIRFELFQLLRVLRHPSLLLQLPDLLISVRRAWLQRRRMEWEGRRAFGLSSLNHLVSPGTGLQGWYKQARATSYRESGR